MIFFLQTRCDEITVTNALNYGVCQVEYTRIKKNLLSRFRVNRENISNYSFCIIIINKSTIEHYFDAISLRELDIHNFEI